MKQDRQNNKFHLSEVPRICSFIQTESKIEVMRSGEVRGKRRYCLVGTEFVGNNEKVLGIDNGDGNTAL